MGYSNFVNEIKGRNAHFVKLGFVNGLYATAFGKITLANDFRLEDIQAFDHKYIVLFYHRLRMYYYQVGNMDKFRSYNDPYAYIQK